MSNKSRWTRDEELNLIKDISAGVSLEKLAEKHNRSISAIELRLKKIIYENMLAGKSLDMISKLLNISEDKTRQYFYSYKEFKEKHTGLVDDINISNKIDNEEKQNVEIQSGGKSSNEKMDKIKSKLKKMEEENKIIKLIVENKELTHKLNKLIKDGKLDESVKKLIKIIRKSNK